MALTNINPAMDAPKDQKTSPLQNAATVMGILGGLANVGMGAYNANTASKAADVASKNAMAQTNYLNTLANEKYLSGREVPPLPYTEIK